MTFLRLAQLSALALAGLTWVIVVSMPGVVGDEYPVMIHAMFVCVVLGLFAVTFFALRWATAGHANHWSTGRQDQTGPVTWLLVAITALMLISYLLLDQFGLADALSMLVIYLLAVTLVPGLFLLTGYVKWPARRSRPSRLESAVVTLAGLGVAASWSWLAWSTAPEAAPIPTLERVLTVVPITAAGATMEEVLFRVLLLTALLDRTGSRFLAVFLSSVAFGLMHVPGNFGQAVAGGDWALFQAVASSYGPEFLLQTLMGLFLGVLWVRSGSIVLIAATHTLFNLGSHLSAGF